MRLDEAGDPQPALAISWRHDSSYRHWTFRLRPGVKFHDGTPLTPQVAARALSAARTGWSAGAAGDELTAQSENPAPRLLFELADARRALFLRSPDGSLNGTGPFRLAQPEPGRHTVLAANEEYWGGRPFLDSITIEPGRPLPQQLVDLELGRADLVELSPDEVRRAGRSGARLWASAPVWLTALVFERGRPAAEDARLREAIALSIDRAAIVNVLLQKQGQPAGGLLPQWLSGYAVLFSMARDLARARQLAAAPPPLSLSYEASDAPARTIAERIAVNTREAGIRLQVVASPAKADVRLVRVRIASLAPEEELTRATAALQLPEPPRILDPATLEALYGSERALVEEFRVVPLFHLPELYGSSQKLKTWAMPGLSKTGVWRFEDLWLDQEQP